MEKLNEWIVELGLAIFAGFVWLLRLEGKTNQNTRDIDRIDKILIKVDGDLSAIRENTAQIKGYLSMPERNKN